MITSCGYKLKCPQSGALTVVRMHCCQPAASAAIQLTAPLAIASWGTMMQLSRRSVFSRSPYHLACTAAANSTSSSSSSRGLLPTEMAQAAVSRQVAAKTSCWTSNSTTAVMTAAVPYSTTAAIPTTAHAAHAEIKHAVMSTELLSCNYDRVFKNSVVLHAELLCETATV